jgi:pilus assembly protein Flp/PilA
VKLRHKLSAIGRRRDDGASAVEYGLLVALIAVVIAATVVTLGTTLQHKFNQACAAVGNNAHTAQDPQGQGNCQ